MCIGIMLVSKLILFYKNNLYFSNTNMQTEICLYD